MTTVAMLVLSITTMVVLADPEGDPNDKFIVEGAHIVSEGAYFRFYVKNNYTQPIYLTFNDGERLYIPSYASTNFNVIAPQVSFPYDSVVYTFKLHFLLSNPDYVSKIIEYKVLVLDSAFVEIFNFSLPFLMIIIGVLVVATTLSIIRRRRIHKNTIQTKDRTSIQ